MNRLSGWIPPLASLAAGALLLQGCASGGVDRSPTTTPQFAVQPGRPGLVVAAAHRGSDVDTHAMVAEIARRTGFGLVVASGVSVPAGDPSPQRVLEAAQGPLRLYAEIHGDDRAQCAGRLEIATLGIERELALRLRALAELIRDAHLRTADEVARLEVRVEPVDAVAHPAGREPLGLAPERALHIALPRCARRDFRDAYTAVLADFLAEAALLPATR
jgi:hypothetical protein